MLKILHLLPWTPESPTTVIAAVVVKIVYFLLWCWLLLSLSVLPKQKHSWAVYSNSLFCPFLHPYEDA